MLLCRSYMTLDKLSNNLIFHVSGEEKQLDIDDYDKDQKDLV